MTTFKPKLIEVALPLDAINKAAAREKSIRHGHPSTLHLWWSRKPLAACRAVLWASLVDDPSAHPERFPSEEDQEVERKRLFEILEDLVVWENSNNPDVLEKAKVEVERCFDGELPAVLDPFAGGGSVPLESQRLGLRVLAGDLNPVAVLINKAMLEIPPRFAGRPPVHPDARGDLETLNDTSDVKAMPASARGGVRRTASARDLSWSYARAQGLAKDIKAYGMWMRKEAERRIGHLYPDAVGPGGEALTPIAWIWARTVRSPDPTWDGHVPLVASWTLRKAKKNKPEVWVEPIVDRVSQTITYNVRERERERESNSSQPVVKRGNGTCIATGAAIPLDYIKAEGRAGRMGAHLLAVVAKGDKGRVYLSPQVNDVKAAKAAGELVAVGWKPAGRLPPPGEGLGFTVQRYGFEEWWQLFTNRQLIALTTFSDLLREVHDRVLDDAQAVGLERDEVRLREGGGGAVAYADAIVTYLAFAIDKCADYWSNICIWHRAGEKMANVFLRQAVTMCWDSAEANPFSSSTGNWMSMLNWVSKAVAQLPASGCADVRQGDARARVRESPGVIVSSDPPYYDNIGYAGISDFFYVWLRRNLADIWPEECATLLTPKSEELIADKSRHESKHEAREYFEGGMAEFMQEVAASQHPDVPATIYYAYKATETSKGGEVVSTGWDTFLQAVVDAGLHVTATWPMRTEMSNRPRSLGSNALASSIVLACRPRSGVARPATRNEFVAALRSELPGAVKLLLSENIAPVDLPQSTIGPGISVFSRYSRVVEANGEPMPVSDALAIINKELDEILHGEESELDPETRFALAWYAQHGFQAAPFGDAESIAKAKNTAVEGVIKAGIGEATAGKFRLYARPELDPDWDPSTDSRLVAWEALQHLAARLDSSESQAAVLLERLGAIADGARQLAYLLHKIASDNRWAEEALTYNNLIDVWPTLRKLATEKGEQQQML